MVIHNQRLRVREYDEDPIESDSSHDCFHEYIIGPNIVHLSSNRHRRWRRAPLRILQELFLPIGYPSSVRQGYIEYQIYDSLQGLCSYLRGVLCSASVLQAAGVGSESALALSAAITWALKDGLSMIGGIAFSYRHAPTFDSHVKEYRLFADLINDVGLTLDMMAPYFHSLLLVSSLAGLCKTLCGISASATKSSITQHFALHGNMADLNAKEATQETLVSLLGMLLGVSLAHGLRQLETTTSSTVALQWLVFGFLTAVHVWANYRGVRLLRLRTLNRERAERVLESLVAALAEQRLPNLDEVPSPEQVDESLVASTRKLFWPGRLQWVRLVEVLAANRSATEIFSSEHYALTTTTTGGRVLVSLLVGATPKDQVKALVHALLLLRRIDTKAADNKDDDGQLVRQTLEQIQPLFEKQALMTALMRRGWEVQDRVYLGFSRRRSQWTSDKQE